MGKKSKTGKQRKDKFYHLAKETGYRARSAFKLIQLNRKFEFLQETRVLIDLCAAPGGWLQVASQNMPVSSIVIGIDLVAIKPIRNVTTFQADITTDHCRQLLKKELKTWKADVVLNDGAPNVGTAWVQDAFSQAQLALSALKLASEHLKKDGWFVTKLFRSKDYTALLWVFQQLFKKVHSTKPQASRNESAEIFVVCQGYLAPDKLDEKFLDPKYVFKEIEQDSKIRLDILRPEKHKRQRDGYPENNIMLHTSITAKQFIDATDAVGLLSTANKIDIVDEAIKSHAATTTEILQCCEDIKVIGRKEIKALFSWRKKLRKDKEVKVQGESEMHDAAKEIEKTEEEKQEELDQVISELKAQECKDAKKKKKRIREIKKKMRERLASKFEAASEDIGIQEQDLFALNLMANKKDLDVVAVADNEGDDIYKDHSGNELEFEENDGSNSGSSDEDYVYGDDKLYEKPVKRKEQDEEPKMKKRKKSTKGDNPLLVDMEKEENEAVAAVNKAKQWYQKDIFKGVEEKEDDDLDDDYDIEQMLSNHKKHGGKVIEKLPEDDANMDDDTSDVEISGEDGSGKKEEDNDKDESDSESENSGSEIDDRSISQGRPEKDKPLTQHDKATKEGFEVAPKKKVHLDPEDLALGAAMATSKKRKRDIVDSAFNRYSFNDKSLPSWFMEDENKHNTRHIPITREEVEFYKQRMRDLNARPIKKVIEAKAKKKSKMLSKLDKVRKKAQGILDASETSQREKQDQIKGIYKKAGLMKKKTPKPTFVVAKKGLAGKKYSRPDNVKGTYKVVDPRMKKDLKAMKNKEKTKGRKRKH